MIFDKFCGIVERHFKHELGSILTAAKIFKFVGIPHDILSVLFSDKTHDEIKIIYDEFFLPFNVIAIEDGGGLIILADKITGQIGLNKKRMFIEVVSFDYDKKYYEKNYAGIEEGRRELANENLLSISIGEIYVANYDRKNFNGIGSVFKSFLANKKCITMTDMHLKIDQDKIAEAYLTNPMVALQEVVFFNQPDKFILEKRQRSEKRNPKKGRFLRSHQRPNYTLLHPADIRKRMGLTQTTDSRSNPRPHERRRHTRYLSHQRYSENNTIEPRVITQGARTGDLYYKRINVPATWIGPSENQVGNKIYKVILDK